MFSKRRHLPIFDKPLTVDVVAQHLKRSFSPNVVNAAGTPLIIYAMRYHETDPALAFELVTLLLDAKADPSPPDEKGQTPVNYGVKYGSVDLTRLEHDEEL
jgi:ankyrin repeat protein